MSVGLDFLVSIAEHQDFRSLSRAKETWFSETENEVLTYLKAQLTKTRKLPTTRTLLSRFPDIPEYGEVIESPEFFLPEIKDRYSTLRIIETIPKLSKTARRDPKKAAEILMALTADITSESGSTLVVKDSDTLDDRFDDYEQREATGGITYLSSGDEVLDSLFQGYSRGDLVTIAGRSGMGKTFLVILLSLLLEEVLPESMNDILFVTNEMPIKEIQERADCIDFRLPYPNFVTGSLNRGAVKRYLDGIERLRKKPRRITFLENVKTTEEILSYAAMMNPSAIVIDGSYMLDVHYSKDSWVQIGHVTGQLKFGAKSLGIPIINTTQLKRGSGKSKSTFSYEAQEEFAFGGSFINDSDLAIPLYQTPEMHEDNLVGIQFAKGRRVNLKRSAIWDFDLTTMSFGIEEYVKIEEDEEESF